jgi:hypothetical protein
MVASRTLEVNSGVWRVVGGTRWRKANSVMGWFGVDIGGARCRDLGCDSEMTRPTHAPVAALGATPFGAAPS